MPKPCVSREVVELVSNERGWWEGRACVGINSLTDPSRVSAAQINCDVAKLGLKVVKSQNKLTQQFTQKDFITRIVQNYRKGVDEEDGGSTILDWEKMRVNCARFFDSAPSCHFLASE